MMEDDTFFMQTRVDFDNNHFAIGTFERGITVYKQQMRAFNLIHKLRGVFGENAKIAVIGGGISGVTTSAAALLLGYNVYLFEKESVLCNLQRGCEIRWIQPYVYDWPAPGSDSSYANLPLLSWRAGTAAGVVEQILNGFEAFVADKEDKTFFRHTGSQITVSGKSVDWKHSANKERVNGSEQFDATIFCVGYGVERSVEENTTFSYWRNDSINQPILYRSELNRARVLVSGTGDGGLIDALRVRIENFNQGKIINEVFAVANRDQIEEKLSTIRSDWTAEKLKGNPDPKWLYERFRTLNSDKFLDEVKQNLRKRLRADTWLQLNGNSVSIFPIWNLDSCSLFNAFMIYLLYESDQCFDYIPGKCELSSTPEESEPKSENAGGSTAFLIDKKLHKFDRYIIRHGADRRAVLDKAGSVAGVGIYDKGDFIRQTIDTSTRLWPGGWWENNLRVNSDSSDLIHDVPTEFISPTAVIIATTFVTTLSDIIRQKSDTDFRITLHRLIKIKDKEYFQQIARFPGNGPEGRIGRIQSIESGITGLACRLGKPIIIFRDEDFAEICAELKWSDDNGLVGAQNVQSWLACPFFAPDKKRKGQTKYVSLALFMDSSQKKFFDGEGKEILKTVYAACRGFVRNLEEMKKHDELHFTSSDYKGHEFKVSAKDQKLVSEFAAVDHENEIFRDFIAGLTFKNIYSFDVELKR